MKRVMLLAILALALPTVALANNIDFSTGPFLSGSFSFVGSPTITVVGGVVGSGLTIRLRAQNISPTPCAIGSTCTFNTGDVLVQMRPGAVTQFEDTIFDGTMTRTSNTATITASLTPNMGGVGPSGGFVTIHFSYTGGTMTDGIARVAAVPEPGTLGMLGTGLIGLAGMARRQLKFWT